MSCPRSTQIHPRTREAGPTPQSLSFTSPCRWPQRRFDRWRGRGRGLDLGLALLVELLLEPLYPRGGQDRAGGNPRARGLPPLGFPRAEIAGGRIKSRRNAGGQRDWFGLASRTPWRLTPFPRSRTASNSISRPSQRRERRRSQIAVTMRGGRRVTSDLPTASQLLSPSPVAAFFTRATSRRRSSLLRFQGRPRPFRTMRAKS